MPPSSSPSEAKVPAAARSMARPPATEPVKLMWSIRPEPMQLLGLLMRHDEIVEQTLGQAGAPKRLGEALADEQRLRGMLQDDRIAGEQAGHDGVDRGEIWIVPRRDDHHDAERFARDVAAEAGLRRREVRLERLLRQRRHGANALLDAALLAAIADGPAPSARRARRRCRRSWRAAHRERPACSARAPEIETARHSGSAVRADDNAASISASLRDRPLGIDRAVNGRDDLYSLLTWSPRDTRSQ